MEKENVLLQDWDFPPFDKIDISHYAPAVQAAIAEAEQAVQAIADCADEATFGNTIEALERADHRLQQVSAVMFNLNECCTSDALQQVVADLQPSITRFATRVSTDQRLFARVEHVWQRAAEDKESLDAEQQTLLRNTRRSFLRHGVALPEPQREEYKRNEEELAALKLTFSRNALADLNQWTMHLTDEADLSGLPASLRSAAQAEAEQRGLTGWVFTLSAPMYLPFMAHSTRRDLRERMYRAYCSIGNRGNSNDNNHTISRICALRARQAHLLGYQTYCDYVLEERMVASLDNLRQFMQGMVEAVLPAAQRDVAQMQTLQESPVMLWDVAYLTEQLRQRQHSFDSEQLRPWFPIDAVRDGIFGLYGRLYGLRFQPADLPVYHPEVQTYKVYRNAEYLGALYLDLHPRASKRSGAWMTEFRGQHGKVRPLVQVVCNFSKPTASEPALLRFAEVETFMHEMGHAMHGMLSQVRYESLGGTNVLRDFVEMPSQLMENWCYEPQFLATFAHRWQTGQALPTSSIAAIRASQNHMAAYLCLRQLNLGLTDIAFHTMVDGSPQPPAEVVEAQAMHHLLPKVEGCCTATNFGHLFGGGYASGYYGYKWAEVLAADIFSRFAHDGIFSSTTAQEFCNTVLSRGGTEHPALLFSRFMGRQPDKQALLKQMNLI